MTSTTETAATAVRHVQRRRSAADGSATVNWPLTALAAVLALTVLIPLYLTVVTALKTPDQLGGSGFEWPTRIRLENFSDAWNLTNFPRALLISAIVTVGAVVLTILSNSLVAYAIARNLHKPFFKIPLLLLRRCALRAVSHHHAFMTTKEMAVLGLDNPVGLFLLYTVYGLSFNVFVYTAFIHSIPRELEEAAAMDGASTWAFSAGSSSRCSPR